MNATLRRAYWPLTAVALTVYLGGWTPGIIAAIALTVLQTVHFALRAGSVRTLDVQVRAAYLVLLLAGLLPWLAPLHVAQLIGLVVRIAFDYCLMARMLALAPWNRPVPLSWALVRWVFSAPPAPGSILARMPTGARGPMRASPTAVPARRD